MYLHWLEVVTLSLLQCLLCSEFGFYCWLIESREGGTISSVRQSSRIWFDLICSSALRWRCSWLDLRSSTVIGLFRIHNKVHRGEAMFRMQHRQADVAADLRSWNAFYFYTLEPDSGLMFHMLRMRILLFSVEGWKAECLTSVGGRRRACCCAQIVPPCVSNIRKTNRKPSATTSPPWICSVQTATTTVHWLLAELTADRLCVSTA